ncbi:MAG: leucyl aminopeptidase [Anaerolineae bacterium]|jgi:leucyl aminopeptidase
MEVKTVQGALYECDADAIIIGLFEGSQPEGTSQAVDQALNGAVSDLVNAGDIQGKLGETAVLYSRGAIPSRRVIVAGMGPQDGYDLEAVRRVAAHATHRARDLRLGRVASGLSGGIAGDDVASTAQAVTEGSLLALYDYRGQKTDEAPETHPHTLELFLQPGQDLSAAQRGIDAAQAIAAGVIVTRDLVNLPPNICTPAYMADIAKQLAGETGFRAGSLDDEDMADLGMGALLAVARGSDTPPHLIVMEHNADHAGELDTIVLVGKGVTFDTGGYSLKSREGMATMKGDMAGAAAVIGAMRAIAALEVPLHVVGLAPAADNMISGHAYRPQEVVIASNGVTIEIISTDAEGRMLLADALVYAGRFQPAAVVDIATLTGTCAAALGGVAAGVFSTDDALLERLQSAAAATAEKLWPLPLFPEYEEAIKSETADVKNSGGRSGGIGSSAIFLRHFTSYPAWAHIDMAGLAFEAKNNPYVPGKGATGFGVRLLTEFVRSWPG